MTAKAPPKPLEVTESTATIRVQAVRPGYYDHIFRKTNDIFDVKPVIASVTGEVIPADKQLSLDRTGKGGQFIRGWMKVLGKGKPVKARTAPLVAQTQAITKSAGEGSLPNSELNVDDPVNDEDVL